LTALFIVDEQVKRVLAGTKSNWFVVDQPDPPQPFQGGYQDFIPFDTPENVMRTSGPPKTSVFDDLCYYFEHHSNYLQLSQHPESCAVFMLKLVASEYVQLIQYIHTLLSHLIWLLSRRQTIHDFRISWVEECWSDLIALQRRIDDYRRNLGAICLSLRSSNAWQASGGWTNPIPDFLFIDEQLQNMREKSETVVAAFNGLADIMPIGGPS
jgi:hypothetical protein